MILNVGALEGKPFKATLEYISPKGITDQGTIKFTIRAAVQLKTSYFQNNVPKLPLIIL